MYEMVVERLEAIADRLERTALSVRRGAKEVESGQLDAVETVLNELIWMTPNLGIQAVISQMVRELGAKK